MKFVNLLILLLFVSQFAINTCNVLERRMKTRKVHKKHKQGPATNKWYQLFMGILTGLGSADTTGIDSCLPKSWQLAENTAESTDANGSTEQSSTSTLLNGISTIVDFVCKWKDEITSMFGRRLLLKNKKRLVERSMRRYLKKKGLWDDFTDDVSDAVDDVSDDVDDAEDDVSDAVDDVSDDVSAVVSDVSDVVSDAVTDVEDVVVDITNWVGKTWDELTAFATQIVTQITSFYTYIKGKVTTFLNSDFVQKLKKLYNCIKLAKSELTSIYTTLKALYTQIAALITGGLVGLEKFFIDLICNFDAFRAAVNILITALNTTDILQKYLGYGSFIGAILEIFATASSKKMKKLNK